MNKKIYASPEIRIFEHAEELMNSASLEEVNMSGNPELIIDPTPSTQDGDARGYSLWDDEF